MLVRVFQILLLACLTQSASAEEATAVPRVVTTIAPLHSLISAVMGEYSRVEMLVAPGSSPHTYRLRPSQIRSAQGADLIVLIGVSELDGFLTPVLDGMDAKARTLQLVDVPGMRLLQDRTGGVHDGKNEANADDDRRTIDGHLWLNTQNAALIAEAVAARLADLDARHAAYYRDNAKALRRRIETLDGIFRDRIEAVRDRPAIVFHDAYQYLEDRYGLKVVATVSVDPEHPPGARRLREISELISEGKAVCLFSEPEYPNRLLAALLKKGIRHASLDPLGSDVRPGPELYFSVMNELAGRIADCLGGSNELQVRSSK